jgi:hypothetical protein
VQYIDVVNSFLGSAGVICLSFVVGCGESEAGSESSGSSGATATRASGASGASAVSGATAESDGELTSGVPDLPAVDCAEGLLACRDAARTVDTHCLSECSEEGCGYGVCSAACDLESAESLGWCVENCEPVDEDEEVSADFECWEGCLEEALACFESADCDSNTCAYLRYTCTLPCSHEPFYHSLEVAHEGSCEINLPGPPPTTAVPYISVTVAGVPVPFVGLDACTSGNGWAFSDEMTFAQLRMCNQSCTDFESQGATVSFGYPPVDCVCDPQP